MTSNLVIIEPHIIADTGQMKDEPMPMEQDDSKEKVGLRFVTQSGCLKAKFDSGKPWRWWFQDGERVAWHVFRNNPDSVISWKPWVLTNLCSESNSCAMFLIIRAKASVKLWWSALSVSDFDSCHQWIAHPGFQGREVISTLKQCSVAGQVQGVGTMKTKHEEDDKQVATLSWNAFVLFSVLRTYVCSVTKTFYDFVKFC